MSGKDMSSFGQWKYTADREATILAYGRTERGGADTCDCAGCRNFRVARAGSFPAGFLALLEHGSALVLEYAIRGSA